MAFTERFVTDAAGGGGVGTEGDPWTLAEGLAQAVAGDRVNILSDSGYSLGADTVTNVGTVFDLIVFRGYDTVIGDLENPGRSATTGKLVTTGFPVITLTGALTPNAFVIFQNLAFTGALSTGLIFSTAIDNFTIIECEVINTQNNASAKAVQLDNGARFINSDFECTGAAHSDVVDCDTNGRMYSCRIKAVAGNGYNTISAPNVVNSLFIGNGTNSAIMANAAWLIWFVAGNTIYNWDTALEGPNAAPTTNPMIINNHITDCANYFSSGYSATDALPLVEMNNRTRDNTTPRTGVGDGVLSGEVTTDTGGIETDYTNAGADDLSLIAAAPGVDTGLGFGT